MSLVPSSIAPVTISGSVGRRGMNRPADVTLVQQLINSRLPIPLAPLTVNGICETQTIFAIEEIQRRELRVNHPDGKVDPGGATLRYLITGVRPAPPAQSASFSTDVIAAAQASQVKWNIPAAITLAQWALESGFGKKMPSGSNNPFGIKATGNDPYVEARTREVVGGKEIFIVAKFKKFASLTDAFDQHGKLLATASPYAAARTNLPDPDKFADALTGVYATDPDYGTILKKLMKTHNLYQYD